MAKQINTNLVLADKRTVDSVLGSINKLSQLRGYDFIVGTQAQIMQGLASHSSIQAAIDSASNGNSIFILAGTYIETVLCNKTLFITGAGYATYINGTVSFNSTSDFTTLRDVRISGNITFASGAQGNRLDCYQTTGSTVADSGTDNLYFVIDA